MGKRMVVVMPFAHDIDMLEQNIHRWTTLKPCTQRWPVWKHVDLILYQSQDAFASDDDQLKGRIDRLMRLSEGLKAFRHVHYLSADLTKYDDKYRLGPSRMFFQIMTETRLVQEEAYNYLFWMEPDCWPVRPGWLDELYWAATVGAGHFWVLGSITRSPVPDEYAHIQEHINGNAIYRLDDPVFIDFLRRLHANFDNNLTKYLASFDTAIFLFCRSLKPFTEQAKIWHKFVYTNLIQNVYRTPTRISDILEREKQTFLLHGRDLIE